MGKQQQKEKKTKEELQLQRQEKLDKEFETEDRKNVAAALKDYGVLMDIKAYMVRRKILSLEGKFVKESAKLTRGASSASLAPKDETKTESPNQDEKQSGSGVAEPKGGSDANPDAEEEVDEIESLFIHRNYKTFNSVPPATMRVLYSNMCPGQLNKSALKDSYTSRHQKQISRAVSDQLFEFLTGWHPSKSIGDVRDGPALLAKFDEQHIARGRPGDGLTGRLLWKKHGVYALDFQSCAQDEQVIVRDRIRKNELYMPLSFFESRRPIDFYVEDNFSDKNAMLKHTSDPDYEKSLHELFNIHGEQYSISYYGPRKTAVSPSASSGPESSSPKRRRIQVKTPQKALAGVKSEADGLPSPVVSGLAEPVR